MTTGLSSTYDTLTRMLRAPEDTLRGGSGATPEAVTFTPSPHAECTHTSGIRRYPDQIVMEDLEVRRRG